jgi:hypothetical protein
MTFRCLSLQAIARVFEAWFVSRGSWCRFLWWWIAMRLAPQMSWQARIGAESLCSLLAPAVRVSLPFAVADILL